MSIFIYHCYITTIDNKDGNTLIEELKNALTTADAIDIFTGYFFFSGFAEIAELIKDKKIRIVVGMDIDPKVVGFKRITDESDLTRFRLPDAPATDSAKIKNYWDSFVALFNNSDLLDKERMSDSFEIFFNKIKDGSLEIRMNLDNHHGKYYLVYNKKEFSHNGAFPGTRFMGSSNFTISGLKGQGELNESSREEKDFKEYSKRFEEAWAVAGSVPVIEKHNAEEFLSKVKKETSLFEDPSPYYVYIRILQELFDSVRDSDIASPKKITGGKYTDFQYQSDAIRDGLDILNKYNGVIVADVVGLGKSIIASGIAANLKKRTIIITPPHLEEQWKEYAYDFKIAAKIYTSGKIEQALKENDYHDEQVIIVDEAHRFRNEDTFDYQNLHKLCLNNKVILLTATPFNNDPKDLFALIRLFDAPSQSRINTVENLSIEFRLLIADYQKMRRKLKNMDDEDIRKRSIEIADSMRKMASPVIIRRSRIDLDAIEEYKLDLQSQGFEFPVVRDPELLNYDLGELQELYVNTLERITDKEDGFTAARYEPSKYADQKKLQEIMKTYYSNVEDFKQAQSMLAIFMRRFLVLRFESSIAAFDSTIGNFINGHKIIVQWWEKFGYVPIYKKGNIPDPESLSELYDIESVGEQFADKDLESALSSNILSKDVERGLMLIPKEIMSPDFIENIRHDIELLEKLRDDWQLQSKKLTIDPKVENLKEKLREIQSEDSNRKVVIFTAYTDTSNYLYKRLKEEGLKVFMYSGAIASKANKDIVRDNFDAGLSDDRQKNDFEILVATDAISEGYNLHRAGAIVNYDIPYNPVRVVQRVGRINRINKKVFDELYIYNCFPSIIGESEVSTKKIASLKMHMMNELMGTDFKALTDDEILKTFFVDPYKEEEERNNEKSWDADYRNFWNKIKHDHQVIDNALNIKQRSFLSRKTNAGNGMVLFGKRGRGLPVFVSDINQEEPKRVSAEDILHAFKSDKEEEAVKRSTSFKEKFEKAKMKLFQQDQLPDNKGRRGDAINTLNLLADENPASKTHCRDARKIITDLDGFPEGTLKRINDLTKTYLKNKEYDLAYKELKLIAPIDYMEALQVRVQGKADEPEVLLIAEELI